MQIASKNNNWDQLLQLPKIRKSDKTDKHYPVISLSWQCYYNIHISKDVDT